MDWLLVEMFARFKGGDDVVPYQPMRAALNSLCITRKQWG